MVIQVHHGFLNVKYLILPVLNVLFIICVILGVLSGLLGLFIKIDFKTTENEATSCFQLQTSLE